VSVALPFTRDRQLAELRRRASSGDVVDLLVVGGGITGAGVALDAAARGLSVVLVERGDLASGTSSKSSKLVHGGLRYLQQGEVRLVYEALRERRRLMRNAPHLVSTLPFMIPILTRDGVVSRRIARALGSAMWMYDLTGGWRIGHIHRRIGADAAHRHVPTMPRDRLSAAYLYYDAAGDDARITLELAATAADRGAVIATYCEAVGFVHDHRGSIAGACVRDALAPSSSGGAEWTVRARAIVNASGVWVDRVAALDAAADAVTHPMGEDRDAAHDGTIRPARGVHITVPWELVRNDVAVVVPSRRDRRSVFLVPWGPRGDGTYRFTYVGTTDTDHHGDLDEPRCTGDDVDYLLDALGHALTTTITCDDVCGVWAGLRPLVGPPLASGDKVAKTEDLSRRHAVSVSASGLVTITGGKLTTYREMAQDTVDMAIGVALGHLSDDDSRRLNRPAEGDAAAVRRLRRARRRHPTRRLRLLHATRRRGRDRDPLDAHLVGRFGTAADEIRALTAFDPTLATPLVDGLPYLAAEVVHAARREMAVTLDDVLVRRTRAHLFDRSATLAAAPRAAALLAAELGWDDDETARQLEAHRRRCDDEVEAARTEPGADVTADDVTADDVTADGVATR
jgi:glycerol-3-phosphate dehydrogenase